MSEDNPGRTTAEAARKRVAEWRDDPDAKKGNPKEIEATASDPVPKQEDDE